ncbi:MAG: Rrf2 family transcriptional regulator [Candidatus Eiseniibacteriota bacterium]|jgi:Rrf2 family protein
MKLRTRARYSLRMMMAIASLSSDGRHVGLGEVASRCSISRKYLEQLVTALRNAQLVRAHAGRSGGYALARRPDEIRVREIIEAAIGPIAVTDCAGDPGSCGYAEFCHCWGLWSLINHRVTEVLDEHTLADILDDDWLGKVREELDGPRRAGSETTA